MQQMTRQKSDTSMTAHQAGHAAGVYDAQRGLQNRSHFGYHKLQKKTQIRIFIVPETRSVRFLKKHDFYPLLAVYLDSPNITLLASICFQQSKYRDCAH